MYAVIETGGKQYRVELGTELEVELLDVEAGQSITLDRVLLVADGDDASIGRPTVANASVQAEVVRQARGDKLIAFKYRPKARRRVKRGHRQELTVLRVTDVVLDGKSAADAARKAEQDAKSERERLAEAAARQAAEDAKLAARLAGQAKSAPADESRARPKARRAKGATEAQPTTETAADAAADSSTSEADSATDPGDARASAEPDGTEAAEAESSAAEAESSAADENSTKKSE